jgi:uncharacterized protein YggE
MDSAASKAGVLATSAKRQLKGVTNIVQGDVQNRPVMFANDMANVQMKAMAEGAASSSVQSGQIEISTTVTVQYEMQ